MIEEMEESLPFLYLDGVDKAIPLDFRKKKLSITTNMTFFSVEIWGF
jgi:hypothetical protein